MLNPVSVLNTFLKNEIQYFAGVPDSLLKELNQAFLDKIPPESHLISTNEGSAVSFGIGYYLATKKPPLIYMQNSGLGNAINPLISLADPDVYGIPMILIIGWRGEPGSQDEPQHAKQGRITEDLLNCLEIPFSILPKDGELATPVIQSMIDIAKKESRPTAILVRSNTFEQYNEPRETSPGKALLSREEAISIILRNGQKEDVVIGTTGMASREIYEFRQTNNDNTSDFLTVGGMGHASQIALGISKFTQEKAVFCFDGDGALLMHLGALATNAHEGLGNFHHIVLNNGAHDSVGGQPTLGQKVSFENIAKSVGFKTSLQAHTQEGILDSLKQMRESDHPTFLEIIIKQGYRSDLGRPAESPIDNKLAFMQTLTNGPHPKSECQSESRENI